MNALAARLRAAMISESFCSSCRLFHAPATTCEVARARAQAELIEVGEEVREYDLDDCDRPALVAALRLRGLSLEPRGDGWVARATLGDGVPVHVEDEDTEPLR